MGNGFDTSQFLNSRPATRPGNANVRTPMAQPPDPRSLLRDVLSPKFNPMPHTPPPADSANKAPMDQGISAYDRMAYDQTKFSNAQQLFWGSLVNTRDKTATPLGYLLRRMGGAAAAGGQWVGDRIKDNTPINTTHDQKVLDAMRPGDVLPPATRPAGSVGEALRHRLQGYGGIFGEVQPTLFRPEGVEKSWLADNIFSERPEDIRKALAENSAHLKKQPMQFTPKAKSWAEDPGQILHDILGIPRQVQPSPVPNVAEKASPGMMGKIEEFISPGSGGFKPNGLPAAPIRRGSAATGPLSWHEGFKRPGLLGLGMNYLPGAMQTAGEVSDILAGTSKFRAMR